LCTSKSSTAFCGEISEQKIGEVGQSPGGVKEKLCANKYILALFFLRGVACSRVCDRLPRHQLQQYRCVSAPCRLFLPNFRSVKRLRRHAKHADVLTVCLQFLIDVKAVKKIPQKYVL
jgi:hypothetical protein